MSESILRFIDYKIDSIKYNLNKGFVAKDDENVEIAIRLKRTVDKKDFGNFQLNLRIILGADDDSQPFFLDIVLMALFETESDIDMLVDNATAIMYPYLRNIVANTTNMCNIPTMTLPVVNISNLFDEEKLK